MGGWGRLRRLWTGRRARPRHDPCRASPAWCGRHVAHPPSPTAMSKPDGWRRAVHRHSDRRLTWPGPRPSPVRPGRRLGKAPSPRQRNGQRHGGARRHRAAHPRLRDPSQRGLASRMSHASPRHGHGRARTRRAPNATTCPTICAPRSTTIPVPLRSGTRSPGSTGTPTVGSRQPNDTRTSEDSASPRSSASSTTGTSNDPTDCRVVDPTVKGTFVPPTGMLAQWWLGTLPFGLWAWGQRGRKYAPLGAR